MAVEAKRVVGPVGRLREDQEILDRPHYSLLRDTIKRLRKNRVAMFAGFYIIAITLAAAAAPLVTPYGRDEPHFDHTREPPSSQFWFGSSKRNYSNWSAGEVP